LQFSQKMNFNLSILVISVAAFSALAHELETLDISGSTLTSTLLNETSENAVCANLDPVEETVRKMLLTEHRLERTEDLNPHDALVVMKQLTSYVNKHVKGKKYYKMAKVIKAEKCNAQESDIHVLEIEIRKTTCSKKEMEEGKSDDKCYMKTDAKVVECIWTGRLIRTAVVESQGLICSDKRYDFFTENNSLCPLLKYDDTDMRRVHISQTQWKWENNLFAYAPPDFSAEFEDSIPHDGFDPSEDKSSAKFNKMDQSVERRSMNGHYKVKDGRPLCPIGRTGIQGRGKLPRWGPNFVLAVIVDSGEGHLLDILSTTTAEGSFSIPTFFIDDYSKEGIEAKLEEVIIASKPTNGFSKGQIRSLIGTAMKNALIIKQGFTPDSRNTDNAWIETIAVQISDPKQQHLGKLKFQSQAKQSTVEWRTVDEKSQNELKNYVELSLGEAKFNEVISKSDKKALLKRFITALTGYTLRGLRFLGGVIFSICAGILVPVTAVLSVFMGLAIFAAVSSKCGEEALESLALVYKPVQQGSKRVLGIACQGAIVPGKHQNYTDTVLVSSYCIVEDPQEGYVVSVGSPDPHGDLQSSAQQFRAQRILNFPFEQHPVGILKTPQPIMYSDLVKPMCIAEVPLPDEHVCILGVVTKGGLMTLRHVQMLYESDCEQLSEGLSSYLCAKVKEIDADVGETFGLDPSLDIYPFDTPLEFDISGVKPGSAQELETLDISGLTPLLSPLNETTKSLVCANPQSIERTVRKILLTEHKVERTEDLNPYDALVVMKQLTSYVNKHVKGKTYYKTTKVIKAEKCNAPESDIHLKEGELDEKCHVRTDVEAVDCIWTGRLTGTTVVESQGLICGDGRYNFFMEEGFLCPLLKYDDTDMRRVLISETHLKWGEKLFAYAPPDFSAKYEDDFSYDNFDPSEEDSSAQFNKMDQSVNRRSMDRPYKVKNGRPLCPVGRTGFQGRGKHPRWGPNFVLAVIVDRGEGDFLDILSTTTAEGPFTIPTFYVDDYSYAAIEAKLEEIIIASKPTNGFSREEIHSLVKMAMKDALLVKQGFIPDARNTDNAWAETIAVQISDPKQQHIGKVEFESKTKSGTVEWRMLDEESQSDLKKYMERSIEENKLKEIIKKIDKKAVLKKILIALRNSAVAGYFLSGLALIGGIIFAVCTGMFGPAVAILSIHFGLAILADEVQKTIHIYKMFESSFSYFAINLLLQMKFKIFLSPSAIIIPIHSHKKYYCCLFKQQHPLDNMMVHAVKNFTKW
ncbi:ADP-ribose pyrophosphatase, mitochondrial, partial [Trichinella pseudospiralis]